MATWFLIIFLSLSFTFILRRFLRRETTLTLPPNPNFIPFLGPLRWFRQGFGDISSYLRSIHHRLGPIISLRIIFFPAIFVSDRFLTHKALVLNGAVFSDRPPALPTGKIITSNQRTISSGSYGATWRLLRRNLTSEILNPSRVRSFSHARRSVLETLISRFRKFGENGEEPIVVVDHLRYAMFSLLVLMCFGDKIDEEVIKKVEFVQRRELTCLPRFNILNLLPNFLTKFFLRKRWEEFYQIRREHKDVLLPLIRSRRKMVESCDFSDKEEYVQSYVDTLLDLELPEEEKRKLNEDEIVSLCSEFLNAGTDTTATALQWIMANLVKNQEIQETLYKEVKSVICGEEEEIKKMKYLKAVVLEGLRLHPPGHLLLPHRVSEDTELGGFKVPKRGTINFNVAEIGRDSTVWDEPMEFKPERFFETEEVDIDITGSRGIKMIPFGAGRRICPGIGLAMLHLEYFVANLVKEFKWIEVDGDQVDLSEKLEFTVVMKYPLKAIAVPRR